MCDKCNLVDRVLHGGLDELSEIYDKKINYVHNGGYFIVIDNPTSEGYMCILKEHRYMPLLIHRQAMADACEGLFPTHRLEYREKSAAEHFCFYLRPTKKKVEPEAIDEEATKKVLKGDK